MNDTAKNIAIQFVLAAALAGPAAAQMDAASEPPQFCIETRRIDTTDPVDDETIVVKLRGSGDYRKITLAPRCPGLKIHDGFSYSTTLPRLCRGDIITVTGGGGAKCGIAEIVTISEEEARALTAAQ